MLTILHFNISPINYLFKRINYYLGPDPLPEKQPGTIRISCVGDSITQGFLASNELMMSWPSQLKAMINDSRVEVFNFGRNGAAAKKVSFNPYWDLNEYQQALISNPDIVIISLGTNDANIMLNGMAFDSSKYI